MSLFNIHYVSLVFLLAAVVVSALPHNVTSTTENVTETKDPVPRQGRAFDVAAMAKTFLTPNNIAQVKVSDWNDGPIFLSLLKDLLKMKLSINFFYRVCLVERWVTFSLSMPVT